MSTATIDIGSLLEVREGFRSGRPCIAGTGVTVHVIAAHHDMGLTPSELLEAFPHTSMAGIYAALAYYFRHKQQITSEIDDEDRWAEEEARRIGATFV